MIDTVKLKAKIVEAGYTQKTLAYAIGMSQNTLSSKINGKKVFDCDEVEAICSTLGIEDPHEKVSIFLRKPSQ